MHVDENDMAIATHLLVILASSGAVALVMQRMRVAAIPAYLITGALIGPHALGLVASPEALQDIAHLAIILLLFGIGLELHLSALKHGLAQLVIAGVGSCALTVLIGWPAAMAFGLRPPGALTIVMGLSLSSTALVLRIIAARRELRKVSGRLSLAILVLQDMIVIGMLALLPLIAKWTVTSGGPAAGVVVSEDVAGAWLPFLFGGAWRIAAMAALVVAGRALLPRLVGESFRGGSLDVMLIVGIAIALAAADLAQACGFSLEMGAFLAGFILAGTAFRHQLAGQIGPLRDLFMAVFFTTLGMELDPGTVAQWWWVILLGAAAMIAIKSAVIGGTSWAVGATAGTAAVVGLSLAQAGEFSLVLCGAAFNQGILNETAVAIVISIVFVSLVLTPALVVLGHRLRESLVAFGSAPWVHSVALRDSSETETQVAESELHAIVAGYGPTGRLVAERLAEAGFRTTIVELNPKTVREQSRRGQSIVFGDVSNSEVLESAGLGHTNALILTVPDDEAAVRACSHARHRRAGLFIVVRIGSASRRDAALRAGADHVIADESAAADALLATVIEHMLPS